jgi:hypothetical protein
MVRHPSGYAFVRCYKAYVNRQYRREIYEVRASATSITEKIVSLLIESGSLYCIIWVRLYTIMKRIYLLIGPQLLYIIANETNAFGEARDFTNPTATAGSGVGWFNRFMPQLTVCGM